MPPWEKMVYKHSEARLVFPLCTGNRELVWQAEVVVSLGGSWPSVNWLVPRTGLQGFKMWALACLVS